MSDKFSFYVTERLSEHMYETPEGYLVCADVPVARIGEYLYKSSEVPIEGDKDGLVKIQRDEDEVFSDTALKSFEGKPVTINHPKGFVTPENWKELSHGHLQNVHRGDGEKSDLAIADLIITTEDAIKLVRAGLREVSCGYDAEYEQIKPGLGRQLNICGNHVALVVKGRAGGRCAIMDKACDGCLNCTCGKNNLDKEDHLKMKKDSKTSVKNILIGLFPKLKSTLDSVKDEDLEMPMEEEAAGGGGVEAAQAAAAEAKQAAIQAVEAAKQAQAAVTEMETAPVNPAGTEIDAEEGMEAGAEEETDPISQLNAKIDALDAKIQMLIDAFSEEEGGEETSEEEMEGGEAEENETEMNEGGESEEEMHDDAEEENREEMISAEKTNDWQSIISRADVISPGIVASKPNSSDFKKVSTAVKRKALSNGMTKDNAAIIKPLLRGKKIKDLTEDALDTAFIAASEMISKINNAKVQQSKTFQMKDLSSHVELAEINKRNKEFWTKK